jgi:hypothetical protein
MNMKFYIDTFRSIRMIVLLVALTLNACAAKPEDVVPTVQRTATLEPTVIPSSIPPSPDPTYVPLIDDITTFRSLETKPDIPPQTIHGVTTVIDSVYVDESRVIVEYTISGLDWPDLVQMDPIFIPALSSTAIHNITRGEVVLYPGGLKDGVMTGSIDQMLTAGAVDAAQTPIVDLQVDIQVDGTGAALYPPGEPGESPQPTPMDLPNIGTFHFAFDIPVYQGIKLMDISQTVEANGISMTLKSLILNHSHIDGLVCFEMPSAQDWQPDVRFGDPYGDDWFGGPSSLFLDEEPFSLTDPERCVGMGTDVFYMGGKTLVTVKILELETSIPESIPEEMVDRANVKLADKGIVFEVKPESHDNKFNILKRPDDIPDIELGRLIWDALVDRHKGPWEFTVEINP